MNHGHHYNVCVQAQWQQMTWNSVVMVWWFECVGACNANCM